MNEQYVKSIIITNLEGFKTNNKEKRPSKGFKLKVKATFLQKKQTSQTDPRVSTTQN